MSIALDAQVRASAQVLAREVGDEVVLMSLATDAYFGLDGTGKRVWQLLGEGLTIGATVEAIAGEYDVSRDQVAADVLALLDELLAEGLVEALAPEG
jgi:hypothetical protein